MVLGPPRKHNIHCSITRIPSHERQRYRWWCASRAFKCRSRWQMILWFISAKKKSILVIGSSCSHTFSLSRWFTLDAHAFNAPPSQHILGYQFRYPCCGRGFTNVFAYDQHRNHSGNAHDARRASSYQSSLVGQRNCRFECPGHEGDAHRATIMLLCSTSLPEIPPHRIYSRIQNLIFIHTKSVIHI